MKKTCKIENTIAALQQAIENKKSQMHQAEVQAAPSTSSAVSHLLSGITDKAEGLYGPISQVLENGAGFAQDFIKKAQQNVKENPWDALRKVAAFSFGMGLFLSRRHLKPQEK